MYKYMSSVNTFTTPCPIWMLFFFLFLASTLAYISNRMLRVSGNQDISSGRMCPSFTFLLFLTDGMGIWLLNMITILATIIWDLDRNLELKPRPGHCNNEEQTWVSILLDNIPILDLLSGLCLWVSVTWSWTQA
jgi:hypothetical protein